MPPSVPEVSYQVVGEKAEWFQLVLSPEQRGRGLGRRLLYDWVKAHPQIQHITVHNSLADGFWLKVFAELEFWCVEKDASGRHGPDLYFVRRPAQHLPPRFPKNSRVGKKRDKHKKTSLFTPEPGRAAVGTLTDCFRLQPTVKVFRPRGGAAAPGGGSEPHIG